MFPQNVLLSNIIELHANYALSQEQRNGTLMLQLHSRTAKLYSQLGGVKSTHE